MKKHLNSLFIFLLIIAFCQRGLAQVSHNSYSGQKEISAPQSITLTDGFFVPEGSELRIFTTGTTYKNCFTSAFTPTTTQNYILTRTFKVANVKANNINDSRLACDENINIKYLDGLGRPMQIVQVQGSPNGRDIIQPIAYDLFGREAKKYEYYSAQSNGGGYRSDAVLAQSLFYSNADSTFIKPNPSPYSATVFEQSPLSRVLEQGGAGDAWQPANSGRPNSGHTIKTDGGTNLGNEVRLWEISGIGVSGLNYYPAASLYRSMITDANWVSGKTGTSEEFKDFQGRVVLSRTWENESKSLNTYYVYDDFGALRYVLPPAVNENGISPITNFKEDDDVFNKFIYGYHYDARQRLTEKKIPGKGWEFMVYNKLNQLVMSQDANQRNKTPQQWTFVKYDALGRSIMTGNYIHSGTNADAAIVPDRSKKEWLQSYSDTLKVIWEEPNVNDISTGYTNNSIPKVDFNIDALSYYDNYTIPGNTFTGTAVDQVGEDRTNGLLTGYKVKNLETGEMLLTVNYYDKKGQIIQAKNKNHLGGIDIVDNAYSFSGELTKSTLTHQLNNNRTTIANRYEYDHVGRGIASFQKINEQAEVGIHHFVYNEIGQVIEKRLHNDIQTTRLSYNERGWLRRSVSNEFSFKLKYEDGTSKGYNGNIIRQVWDWGNNQNPSDNIFNYEYDRLSRLTLSETAAGLMTERIVYDEMGNIKNLSRDGSGMNEYHYDGNQLKSIDNITSQSYVYDNNGNAKKDGRNGMLYSYNYLDLPEKASKNSDSVMYTYDAMGQKLKKTTVFNGIVNIRDYVGPIEYNNGLIELIHTEEGIAQRNGSNNYTYNYNLTDHLGNVRLTFDVYNNSVHPLQKDDYYAFGLRKSAGLVGSNDNKYLYNGKEIQEELGGQYDFGARFYDPVTGRWNAVDAWAEDYSGHSPYNYGFNNPVRYIDPTGNGPMDWYLPLNITDINKAVYFEGNAEIAGYTRLGSRGLGNDEAGNAIRFNYDGSKDIGALTLNEVTIPGQGPSLADKALDIGISVTPVLGSGRDLYRGLRDGNWWQAGTGLVGLTFDLATLGTGSIIKGGLKAGAIGIAEAGAREALERTAIKESTNLWKVGVYEEIRGLEAGLDAHHVGQKALMKDFVVGYDLNKAPSILVPEIGHRFIGPNGIVSRSRVGITHARDLLARDIRELRRVYGSQGIPNSSLQELIEMNKAMYPEAFLKIK